MKKSGHHYNSQRMKILFYLTLSLLLTSPAHARNTGTCSDQQIRVLHDLEFIEAFVDKHGFGMCRIVQVYERDSSRTFCTANIRVREIEDPLSSNPIFVVEDCTKLYNNDYPLEPR